MAKPNGSFLRVHLVLTQLEHEAFAKEHVDEILNSLPGDLSQMYTRILKSIERETRRSKMAKSILTWVALAVRPMIVDKFHQAIQLDIKETPHKMEQTIANTCGQLVFVDENRRVQMLHETTREFLSSEGLDSRLAMSRPIRYAHPAVICLSLFCSCLSSRKSRGPPNSQKTSPIDICMLEYASQAFSQHPQQSVPDDSEPLAALF